MNEKIEQEKDTFTWRLSVPVDGSDLILEPGTILEDVPVVDYITGIGQALIDIGTNFLISVIAGEVDGDEEDPEDDDDLGILGDMSYE